MQSCPQAGKQVPVIAVNFKLHLWNVYLWYFYTLGHRMAENTIVDALWHKVERSSDVNER